MTDLLFEIKYHLNQTERNTHEKIKVCLVSKSVFHKRNIFKQLYSNNNYKSRF